MDIYSFINSNAIAEHCRKLNHQFTPVEMAYLIRESEKHTIPEKHAAYRELIDTTPDMPVEAGGWRSEFDSLHRFLERYMQLEDQYLVRFYLRDKADCVFSYEYDVHERLINYKANGGLHRSYDSCYQELKEEIEGRNEDITDIRITKQWLMDTGDNLYDMVLHITANNIPTELGNDSFNFLHSDDSIYDDIWDDLWPVMPTPFKKGDILCFKSRRYEEVLVIDWIPYWEDKDMCSRGLSNYRESPHTKAYRQNEDGSVSCDTAPYYMYMEFYDGNLDGKKRILKAISSYLKGEIDFEVLISAYSLLMRDEYVDDEDTHIFALLGPALFEGKAGVRGPFEEEGKNKEPEGSPVTGIYSFINSDAIARHCSKINHRFTPIEGAYLIHESEKHTIPQKHDAWKKLIETTPDVEVKERFWTPHFDSLHSFLKRYMEIENKYIDLFYRDEPECVYSFRYLCKDDHAYAEGDGIYANFASCFEGAKAEIEGLGEIIDLRVSKQWFTRGGSDRIRKLTLCITCNNIPVKLWNTCGCMDERENEIYMAFDGLWPEIPTPFQKGDILIAKSKYIIDPDPVVLDWIPYWTEGGKYQQLVELHRDHGDSSDLITRVYSQEICGTIQHGDGPIYLDLEYYREDLCGIERTLIAVSEFLKGELDIETLMYAYDLIKCKDFVTQERWHLEDYGDEVCIKAGIKDEDEAQ